MKVVLSLLVTVVSIQAQAIDFNEEINQAAKDEYQINQKVIADSNSSEVVNSFEQTFRNPETSTTAMSVPNLQLLKLRAKKVKIATR
ncbi:hypothetical protein [Bdellovibrio sp. HCB2-146]|uniref:hypothetical protein n=1 Tax=Bdellovibrio sp. HCB2-146 TaxID=3394362 RepID=UPI0039BCA3F3